MILKIFNRGKSRGEGPINYLLGENFLSEGQIREGARVLSGDVFITQELINSSNFAKRYTSGVLSFEERPDEISEDIKQKILQDFEKAMFPGMQPDRYNILWVEHTDKPHPDTGQPRLELNFLIPTTEIYTGKRLQPYFHTQDAKYFRAWQTLTNNKFGLSDPDDPTHFRRTNKFDSNQSPEETHKKLKDKIANYLQEKLEAGRIQTRDDVIFQLEQLAGENIKVTRRSKKFISITSGDSKKPIRLRGFLYEENFSYAEYQSRIQMLDDAAEKTAQKIETATSKKARFEQAREDFVGIYEYKKNLNIKKYNIPNEEVEWVAKYFVPIDIENHYQATQLIQSNEQKNATPIVERGEVALAPIDEKVAAVSESPVSTVNDSEVSHKVSEDLSTDDLIPDIFSVEQIQREQAKRKAQEKAEAQEKERRRLEEAEQQRRRCESVERRKREEAAAEKQRLVDLQLEAEALALARYKARQQRQAEEDEKLVPVFKAIKIALTYCSDYSPAGYEQGYRPLKSLIKENFKRHFKETESDFFDTVRLSLGRFGDTFYLTRDGRVGIDDSAYSNTKSLKFFYSSDLFELKDNKLYIKHTDTFYDLARFDRMERNLVMESLSKSQADKLDIWSRPRGLEDAYITYAASVKVLPDHSLDDILSNDNDEKAQHSENNTPPFPNRDDNLGPGF